MAEYPAELVRVRTLFDGSQVTIRPIRPEDAPMEQDFVRHLSPDSRYARFMGALKELPADKLKYLTDIDYEHHLALVAVAIVLRSMPAKASFLRLLPVSSHRRQRS